MRYFGNKYAYSGNRLDDGEVLSDPYFFCVVGYCPECGKTLDVLSGYYTKDYKWEPSFIPELWKTRCCGIPTNFPWDPQPAVLIPAL